MDIFDLIAYCINDNAGSYVHRYVDADGARLLAVFRDHVAGLCFDPQIQSAIDDLAIDAILDEGYEVYDPESDAWEVRAA